jgi:hypothetical protein
MQKIFNLHAFFMGIHATVAQSPWAIKHSSPAGGKEKTYLDTKFMSQVMGEVHFAGDVKFRPTLGSSDPSRWI